MILDSSENNILNASQIIKSGGIIAFPTETVYGLGANCFNDQAIDKIYNAKNRPKSNPLIAHILNTSWLDRVCGNLTDKQLLKIEKLSKFWPGPLTLILPSNESVSKLATAGLNSIGIRIPNNNIALKLIEFSDLPIVAPSANPANFLSPTNALHVEEFLGDKIDMVIDGGECQVGIESTIISLLEDKPKLLRAGIITVDELEESLKEKIAINNQPKESLPESPGQFKVHYSPKTKLCFFDNQPSNNKNIARIKFNNSIDQYQYQYSMILSPNNNLYQIASGLFKALHEVDKMNFDEILIDPCEERGIGLAIMDRLKKATAK